MKTGAAFPDYISLEKRSRFKGDSYNKGDWSVRVFLLPVFIVSAAAVLLFRLFSIQILQGNYYKNLSDSNRIRTSIIHAPRGIIFDRDKTPLVFNIPGFRETVEGKVKFIGRDKALKRIATGEKSIEMDALRQYPYKDAFAHVLGYIGQISKEEIASAYFQKYRPGDLVGKIGIEKQYETELVGVDGKKLVEVDNRGKVIRTLGQTDPISGRDVILALDVKLQASAFKALKNVKKGVVIVSSPTGEILTLISKPSFDPNLFTLDETYQASEDTLYKDLAQILLDSDNQPLLNRAISGVYPPGSTFKLVTAASGLEDKIIDENFVVNDTGTVSLGRFSFANWYFTQYGKTEGEVNVVKAIKRSNDTFFYKLAEKIGVDKLSAMAEKFGAGKKTGIDLEGEASGILPTDSWKEKAMGDSWYLGDTYHYGIGQGYLLATPLQVNMWTSVIANSGMLYEPHLLKNQKSKIPTSPRLRGASKNQKFLSGKTVDLIRQGMIESCSPGGVVWPLFEFKVQNSKLKVDGKNFIEVPQSTISAQFKDYRQVSIACKTGTAQHGGEETLPHAWITLFVPAYNPEIIVTVLAESSGEGSNIAAPVAKEVLEEWFGR